MWRSGEEVRRWRVKKKMNSAAAAAAPSGSNVPLTGDHTHTHTVGTVLLVGLLYVSLLRKENFS